MTCEMMQPFVKASSYYAEHRLLFQLLVVFALAMQALDSFCFTLVYVSKHMVSEPQLCNYLTAHLWFSGCQAYRPSQDFILYVVFF